jgi:hypothetical protein
MVAQACFTTLLQRVVYLLNGTPYETSNESMIAHCCLNFTRNLYVGQFYLACINVRARIDALNSHLEANLMRKKFSKHERFSFKYGKLFGGLCDSIERVNSFATKPFALYFPLFTVYNIFSAYGIVKNIMQSSVINYITLYLFGYCLLLLAFVCREGDRLTRSAKATMHIFGQIMSENEHNKDQQVDLTFLSTQMRLRNLKVQNFLFTIDTKTFLAVSQLFCLSN